MRLVSGGRVVDWSDRAVIGVVDVLRNYGYFRGEFDRMRREVADLRPDAVVFIDYPGFNLRLAAALRREVPGVRLIYYISPQVWAWNRGRIGRMARILDLMLCIFPFEAPLYERSGLRTVFVGHPMVDALEDERVPGGRDPGLVALLPGSRRREIGKIFPVMVAAIPRVRAGRGDVRFVAAAASDALAVEMRRILGDAGVGDGVCAVRTGNVYEIMQRAGCGLVASGTATLEAAYFGLPYALVYRVSWATYWMARLLVKVDYLGMANILAGREVVREYIQSDATPARLSAEVLRLLGDECYRGELLDGLSEAVGKLGPGGASARAADAVLEEMGFAVQP